MMIAAYPDTYRPQLRAEIAFGPPLLMRGNTTYIMKDDFTGWYYELDMVEYFILSRMDGNHTLAAIEAAIQQHYGHGLSEHAWEALFKQIDQRQLLSDHADSSRLAELKKLDKRGLRTEHQGLLRRHFILAHPDGFLVKLLPWVRFAFHPVFVLPAILAIVGAEIYTLLNLKGLIVEAWNTHEQGTAIPLYAAFVVLLYILPALHETAHGLACKRFGGRVMEMGVIWRFMSFYPYCKLDDMVMFHNRWHRVYTAFAGTFFSLLLLVPFAILWQLSPEKSLTREFSALMLTLYNVGMLLNFLPFLELDGYFMLAHALSMPDLRRASNEFWGKKLTKLLFKREEIIHHAHHFGKHGARMYTFYGIASIALTTLIMVSGAFYWLATIRAIVGDLVTWVILGGIGLYVLYSLVIFVIRLQAMRHPGQYSSRFHPAPAVAGGPGNAQAPSSTVPVFRTYTTLQQKGAQNMSSTNIKRSTPLEVANGHSSPSTNGAATTETATQPTSSNSQLDGRVVMDIQNITKDMPLGHEKLPILKGISFQIHSGEFVAIVGPSGAGKSTLLGIIAGLDNPSSGQVLIDGTDITHMSERRLAGVRNHSIGMVFQAFNLIPTLTAQENVEIPLYVGKHKSSPSKRARELLELVGLSHRFNHRPSQLSGGEQQRVAIARALATDPAIVIADEPTGNLDSRNSDNVLELIADLRQRTGKTFIIATHSPEIAEHADRVIRVVDGQIAELETADGRITQ